MFFLKNLLENIRKKEKEMSFQHDINFEMNTYPMNFLSIAHGHKSQFNIIFFL